MWCRVVVVRQGSNAVPNVRRRAVYQLRRSYNGVAAVGDRSNDKSTVMISGDHTRHHHHADKQQQQQAWSTTSDRVRLTEQLWNLGRVTRAAAVHALRHAADGVNTKHIASS